MKCDRAKEPHWIKVDLKIYFHSNEKWTFVAISWVVSDRTQIFYPQDTANAPQDLGVRPAVYGLAGDPHTWHASFHPHPWQPNICSHFLLLGGILEIFLTFFIRFLRFQEWMTLIAVYHKLCIVSFYMNEKVVVVCMCECLCVLLVYLYM